MPQRRLQSFYKIFLSYGSTGSHTGRPALTWTINSLARMQLLESSEHPRPPNLHSLFTAIAWEPAPFGFMRPPPHSCPQGACNLVLSQNIWVPASHWSCDFGHFLTWWHMDLRTHTMVASSLKYLWGKTEDCIPTGDILISLVIFPNSVTCSAVLRAG